MEEIKTIYGADPIIEFDDTFRTLNPRFFFVTAYFEVPPFLFLMKLVQLRDKYEFLKKKTIKEAEIDFEELWDLINLNDLSGGLFFPYVKALPSKYVFELPYDFLETLKTLKNKGKTTFLITNSPFGYVDVIMRQVVGEDWKENFSFFVMDARKPGFWTKDSAAEEIDSKTGKVIGPLKEIREGSFSHFGNVKMVNDFLQKKYGRVSALFYGDNPLHDCYLNSENCTNWDSVLVYEELHGIPFPFLPSDHVSLGYLCILGGSPTPIPPSSLILLDIPVLNGISANWLSRRLRALANGSLCCL